MPRIAVDDAVAVQVLFAALRLSVPVTPPRPRRRLPLLRHPLAAVAAVETVLLVACVPPPAAADAVNAHAVTEVIS